MNKKILAVLCALTMSLSMLPQAMAATETSVVQETICVTEDFDGYSASDSAYGFDSKVMGYTDVTQELTIASRDEGKWMLSQKYRGASSDSDEGKQGGFGFIGEGGLVIGQNNWPQQVAANFVPASGAAKTKHLEIIRDTIDNPSAYTNQGKNGDRYDIRFLVSEDENSWYGITKLGYDGDDRILNDTNLRGGDLALIKCVNGTVSVIGCMTPTSENFTKLGTMYQSGNEVTDFENGNTGDSMGTSIFAIDVDSATDTITAEVKVCVVLADNWNKYTWKFTATDADFETIYNAAAIPAAVMNCNGVGLFDGVELAYTQEVLVASKATTVTDDFESYTASNSAYGFDSKVMGYTDVTQELTIASRDEGKWMLSQKYRGASSDSDEGKQGGFGFIGEGGLIIGQNNWPQQVAANFAPASGAAKTKHLEIIRSEPANASTYSNQGNGARYDIRFLVSEDENSWYGITKLGWETDDRRLQDENLRWGDLALIKCVNGTVSVIGCMAPTSENFTKLGTLYQEGNELTDVSGFNGGDTGGTSIFAIDVDSAAGTITAKVKTCVDLSVNWNKYTWEFTATDADFETIYNAAAIPAAVMNCNGVSRFDDVDMTYTENVKVNQKSAEVTEDFASYTASNSAYGFDSKVMGYTDVTQALAIASRDEGKWMLSQKYRGASSDSDEGKQGGFGFIGEGGLVIGQNNWPQQVAANFVPASGAAKTKHLEIIRSEPANASTYSNQGNGQRYDIRFLVSENENSWYGITKLGYDGDDRRLYDENLRGGDLALIKCVNGEVTVIGCMTPTSENFTKLGTMYQGGDEVTDFENGNTGDSMGTSIFAIDVDSAAGTITAEVKVCVVLSDNWNKYTWKFTATDADFETIYNAAAIPVAVMNCNGVSLFDDVDMTYTYLEEETDGEDAVEYVTAVYDEDLEGFLFTVSNENLEAEAATAYVAYYNGNQLVYTEKQTLNLSQATQEILVLDEDVGTYTNCKLMIWDNNMASLIGSAFIAE